jgi:predicted nucleic-acid-binding protein
LIGLDTNLLLRALLLDEGAGSERARRLAADRCTPGGPGVINHMVLCEAVWTLARSYRYSRSQVADAVAAILAAPELRVLDREPVEDALDLFRTSRADFADALIGVLNRRAGCATTYTFDRRAAATADFTAVG